MVWLKVWRLVQVSRSRAGIYNRFAIVIALSVYKVNAFSSRERMPSRHLRVAGATAVTGADALRASGQCQCYGDCWQLAPRQFALDVCIKRMPCEHWFNAYSADTASNWHPANLPWTFAQSWNRVAVPLL